MNKEFKYKMKFDTCIKASKIEDGEKIIALASKSDNLNKLLPKDVNLVDNIGFLVFNGEAFVANTLNANSDGVKTEEAIKLCKGFPLTYIDINHKRDRLCGVVIASTYTDYKTGDELSEAEVIDRKDPFAVTITGIIWRAPNPKLAESIEGMKASDSPLKDSIYLSWEVAFDDIEIIVMDAKDNKFSNGEFIVNADKINTLSKKLISNGGNGFTEEGKKIGRVPVGDIVALGVGLVENPAADVAPIEVDNTNNQANASIIEDNLIEKIKVKVLEILNKEENNISQAKNDNVTTNNDNIKSTMKIEKIEQLTDENLKTLKVSELQELFASNNKQIVEDGIKKISEDFVTKLSEKDAAMKAANESAEKLKATVSDIEKKLQDISVENSKLIEANKQREAVESFSARMEAVEKSFDLDDKQKEIVANKVKTCNTEEDFSAYLAEIEVLLAAKKKAPKKDIDPDKDKDNDTSKKGDTDKDADKSKQEAKASVNDALKNGKPDEKNNLPNAAGKEESLAEKAKKVFGIDGWTVTDKRKGRI